MARTTAYHVLADEEEKQLLQNMAHDLHFEKPAVALREIGLAVAGEPRSLARVAPFLRDFRARLDALEKEG